jgi:hypothetical protein
MEEAHAILSDHTPRTGFVDKYLLHARARAMTAPDMQRWMQTKMPRRWKFESYQKEQRAIKKLATSLLGGLSSDNTLLVWGNGGFGPTSCGHASAPNKKMQRLLSSYIPVTVGSEYRSSVTSACHHGKVVARKDKSRPGRHTVVTCIACNVMLGRDANAAHVIADTFSSMRTSPELPLWITNDQTRTHNSLLVPLSIR